MDKSVIEEVARKNIARFRALLRSQIDEADRHGLLKLLAEEQRKLLQIAYEPTQQA
jgi:hypothetical protein